MKLLDFILLSIFLLGFFPLIFSPADCSAEDFVLLIWSFNFLRVELLSSYASFTKVLKNIFVVILELCE